ncbi:MAG: menaquinol-cytochrome c reductase cytochrome b subunit [Actinomycetota bacterium]|nr:menaquinol-cytochrome c reductase cytochrome b subunit [Actinomycetota bacterium]MDK1017719.1 menaquinol-cytochrome c reductase cytochrome b subunit [Actinomycetota bacterium]MDK1026954.1 menaquinol-cytochrome c reductase cytochrome b subunit [Actinomycetota bacterium]MDK1038311.1 menaquinol-cytochrome c reductase cytochrome b subunit [Actinomycetota bacterium]MDK1097040.1 menaquinol-cytochrome c reductase cytochrome b subunit [Actinomycetota bacterium]
MPQLPEHLLRRSAEAKAKAQGRPVEEILAEMKGEEAPAAPAQGTGDRDQVTGGEGRDLDAEAGKYGVPRPLLERAMFARAKADGTAVPAMAGAPAEQAAAVSSQASAAAAVAAPAAPVGPPPGVRTQRLLTVVKAGAIQGTGTEPQDKVNVWPHLLAIEFVALLAMLAFLTLLSAYVDAPLLEFANFNEQPNPSKAPWYFLGLQELLAYFDPQVAGVIIPGFGVAALAFIPYIDRNPSIRPADRKFAISLFTVFFVGASVLTIFGSFFRGPGFNFVFPWTDGIFFDDLRTILE